MPAARRVCCVGSVAGFEGGVFLKKGLRGGEGVRMEVEGRGLIGMRESGW